MILKMSFVSEYLIMPRYIGKARIQIRYIDTFKKTEGIILITLGRSTNKGRMRKNENRNEKVIITRSQENIIQRGANLFVKCVFIIEVAIGILLG